MKKWIAVFVIITMVAFGLCACQKTPDQVKAELFTNYDRDHVEELKAAINGDTYCSSCKKYSEGEHRICPHCGQYTWYNDNK